jgi:hypothetical protein
MLKWEEWVAMGEQMKKARLLLMDEALKYNKTSERARHIRRAIKGLEIAMCKLDDLIYVEFPDHEPPATHVFYGQL